jgi:hypothetical protein
MALMQHPGGLGLVQVDGHLTQCESDCCGIGSCEEFLACLEGKTLQITFAGIVDQGCEDCEAYNTSYLIPLNELGPNCFDGSILTPSEEACGGFLISVEMNLAGVIRVNILFIFGNATWQKTDAGDLQTLCDGGTVVLNNTADTITACNFTSSTVTLEIV